MVCGVNVVVPKPLPPTSFDARFTVIVPLRSPATLVFTPACSAPTLLAPPAMPLAVPPLLVAWPVLAPKLADNVSVNAPAGAVLVIVSACVRCRRRAGYRGRWGRA